MKVLETLNENPVRGRPLTCGSTSYEAIPPVPAPAETSGGVLSAVNMVVQRRDGPRRLRDDDDEDEWTSRTQGTLPTKKCRQHAGRRSGKLLRRDSFSNRNPIQSHDEIARSFAALQGHRATAMGALSSRHRKFLVAWVRKCWSILLLLLLLHPLNGLFYRTTWVSRYQKGYSCLYLNEARDCGVLGCAVIFEAQCTRSLGLGYKLCAVIPTSNTTVAGNGRTWLLFGRLK